MVLFLFTEIISSTLFRIITYFRGTWLAQLVSVWLRLRSWSHGLWVRAPNRALCCQHGAHSGPLCAPFCLALPCLCLSLSKINNIKKSITFYFMEFFTSVVLRNLSCLALTCFHRWKRNDWHDGLSGTHWSSGASRKPRNPRTEG